MALLILVILASLLVAALIAQPWLKARRRARLRRQPFPAAWRRILRRRVPQVALLPSRKQLELKQHMQVFLAEKAFIGCGGLRVTDEMRVSIAAQACLLLLGRSRDYFPELRQILLYPGAFIVDRLNTSAGGVQREQRQVLAGESWTQGQVLLSWEDALQGAADPADGRNVVIHEFAHQLDQEKGYANGAPRLGSRAAYAAWSTVMQQEFAALQSRVERGEWSLMSAYGATDPAEFFAVGSEVFFEQPQALRHFHPALYQAFSGYYQLDPAGWN